MSKQKPKLSHSPTVQPNSSAHLAHKVLYSDPGNTEPEHQKNRILPKKRLIPLNNIGARRTLCLEYKTIFFKNLKFTVQLGKDVLML